MKIAYTILEIDRHSNSNILRSKLSFLPHLKTEVCDGRKEFPTCCEKYPNFQHIFDSVSNTGIIGLWISILNALHSLLESNYEGLLLLEDDVTLSENFEKNFLECVKELPDDWGFFTLGCREVYLDYYNEKHDIEGKKNICRMYQEGDGWGLLFRKEFAQDLLTSIVSHKILGGISDTAIMSYALGNVGYDSFYKPYSVAPQLGNLVSHNNDQNLSTLNNSPIKTVLQ